ncbi:MAG: lysophospholipid acyltransferase family protein [Pseudomonadota bacterium]
MIFCANHPSWWDPITLMLLAGHYFPERSSFGPIDAAALARYPLLGKLGLFGVERDSRASLRQFTAAGDAILTTMDTALGITVQGEFTDPRARPVAVEAGVAHLMRRHPLVPVVPVAIEYPFWDERWPEVLVRFGPTEGGYPERARQPIADIREQLALTLASNQDALAALAATRDPTRFETIVEGRKGVGGVYDLGRRLRAWLSGQRFDAAHGSPEVQS